VGKMFDWHYHFLDWLERRGVECPFLFVPTVIVGVLLACAVYWAIEMLVWSGS
jgi:hypothetical protein